MKIIRLKNKILKYLVNLCNKPLKIYRKNNNRNKVKKNIK